jgi:hypothetical protein
MAVRFLHRKCLIYSPTLSRRSGVPFTRIRMRIGRQNGDGAWGTLLIERAASGREDMMRAVVQNDRGTFICRRAVC